jgi:hypothetical protein
MTFIQSSCALIVFVSLGAQVAYGSECVVSGPRYGLTSDTVDWSIKIDSGQTCVRGLRFNDVAIQSVKLVSPPQAGQVTLLGPGFTYSAKSNYEGRDSFTVEVSGIIRRTKGRSTIRITVLIGNPGTAAPIFHDRVSEPLTAPKPQSVDNNLPLPDSGSLAPCPTWDWSKGSPSPS